MLQKPSEFGAGLVALRKESVDRNASTMNLFQKNTKSLSARRAWIEMPVVAVGVYYVSASLSARRAWIEIKYAL